MRLVRNKQNATPGKTRQTVTFSSLLPVIGLLLLYVLVRNQALSSFPPFIDEIGHIRLAQQVLAGHVWIGATESKLLVPWWLAVFQPYGPAAVWIGRAATILFSMIGLAAVYKLGAQLSFRWAGMLAVLVYILAPFLFFFERMVLTDPYMATCSTLCALFAARLLRRVNRADAVLCGLGVAAAMGAKGSGIVLVSIPIMAVLILPQRTTWRLRISWLAYAIGTFA